VLGQVGLLQVDEGRADEHLLRLLAATFHQTLFSQLNQTELNWFEQGPSCRKLTGKRGVIGVM
jgi:hypothetical protein